MIRTDKEEKELEIAEALNKIGAVRLWPLYDEPSKTMTTIRKWDGSVIEVPWKDSDSIESLLEMVRQSEIK